MNVGDLVKPFVTDTSHSLRWRWMYNTLDVETGAVDASDMRWGGNMVGLVIETVHVSESGHDYIYFRILTSDGVIGWVPYRWTCEVD